MQSFEQIFDEHKQKVFALCFRYLQQTEEAEDAVQDIFLKVYRKMDSFREEAQAGTWIYRITVNHCLDLLRRKKRKAVWARIFSGVTEEQAANLTVNINTAEEKEALALINKCLAALPEKQLTAIVLNRLEGMSMEKTAEIMGISYKAAESLVQRAKKNLAEQLQKHSRD